MPLPSDPRRRRLARAARAAACTLLAVALIAPIVQFEVLTVTNLRRAGPYADQRVAARAMAVADTLARSAAPGVMPIPPNAAVRTKLYLKALEPPPKTHKGAIGRWRQAVHQLWDGVNIYETKYDPGEEPAGAAGSRPPKQVWLHPNMPFTAILLTPLACLPVWLMALVFNLLKAAALVLAVLMAAAVANHGRRRMPDWVLTLAVLWAAMFLVGDIQHGNTNGFVLAAIALHLWLYRRGRDAAAGAALALAICLKMTPALFLLYWLYQRNWRLLAACALAGVVFVAAVPAAALGPQRSLDLTATWLRNLILPGLVRGQWYPVHVNQSLPGVVGRYLLGPPQPGGNIFWNPDDNPYATQEQFAWIAVASLSPEAVRWLIRLAQAAVVAAMAWAIGRRRLPRDDGRRAIHYGIVALGMLLLNQRTWDHHAGILLVADAAIWQAIAFGRLPRGRRLAALILTLLAGACVWLSGTGVFKLLAKLSGHGYRAGGLWADYAKAYGPTFCHFVLLLIASVLLARSLARVRSPYVPGRQKLFAAGPGEASTV
jgi:hypothetical protein